MLTNNYEMLINSYVMLTNSYLMLTNKMHTILNCFNSVLLLFMFRTFYVHLQEDCIVHAVLCVMLFMHLCK